MYSHRNATVLKLCLTVFCLLGVFFMTHAQLPPKSFENVSYGGHARNVFDLWQAQSNTPTPLLIYIHGGAWLNNDKSHIDGRVDVQYWLDRGVSVASISYRHSSDSMLPAPVHDAARFLQFIRYNATSYNIYPAKIALQGSSAGGCTSLYLALHDDLADPSATDPVKRESTRVLGAYAQAAQTTIDPIEISELIPQHEDYGYTHEHAMFYKAVGEPDYQSMINNYAMHQPLFDQFSATKNVDQNDPPIFLSYSQTQLPPPSVIEGIHHAKFGDTLKVVADNVGYQRLNLKIGSTVESGSYASGNQFLEDLFIFPDPAVSYGLVNRSSQYNIRNDECNPAEGTFIEFTGGIGVCAQWEFVEENGNWLIQNKHSGLNLRNKDCNTAFGTSIELTNGTGVCAQWEVEFIETVNGTDYYTLKNVHSGLYMRGKDCNSAPGTLMELSTAPGVCAQWEFVPLGSTSSARLISQDLNEVLSVSEDKISIYPNPVSNYINVSGLKGRIEIFSTGGQKMYQSEERLGDSKIDISAFPTGIYLLRTNNNLFKVIKE